MRIDDDDAREMNLNETIHSMKRRSSWHNYQWKGAYMLTLVVEGRMPVLGELVGRADAPPGSPDSPRVVLSRLGEAILNEEIRKIEYYYPMITVWEVCIMPDHIHLIVKVKENLPEGKHLGKVVSGFKMGCNKAYWQIFHIGDTHGKGLFERGYNDKVLVEEGLFDRWIKYLRENPRRLLIKRQYPEYFTVLHDMEVAGRRCQIVGNRFLLDIPDKMAVVVHRRYSEEEYERLYEAWMACGERGGVLVSAAISPKEKVVLRAAMDRGYRVIFLRENGFPALYKPSGESFYACSRGLLLQISPWEYHMQRKTISRSQCLELNEIAEKIAEGGRGLSSDGIA